MCGKEVFLYLCDYGLAGIGRLLEHGVQDLAQLLLRQRSETKKSKIVFPQNENHLRQDFIVYIFV